MPVLSDIDKIKDSNWTGKTGFVHEAVINDFADLSDYDVYACGPPPMINAVFDYLQEIGLNKERLFSDSFEFAAK